MKHLISKNIVIVTLLLSFVAGTVFEVLYHTSENKPINVEAFRNKLVEKQTEAEQNLKKIGNRLNTQPIDSIFTIKFAKNDISYYLLNENNELIYWSDNYTDIAKLPLKDEGVWEYFISSNAHCISRFTKTKQGVLLSVIRIKNNYPIVNNQLINNYAKGFKIDQHIDIESGKKTDKWAFDDAFGNYLFSFKVPSQSVLNQNYGIAGFIFQFICLISILILLARIKTFFNIKTLTFSRFLIALVLLSGVVVASLYFKFPHLLYYEVLSSAFDYSSGFLLASIIHLTILTAFVIVVIYVFFMHVSINFNRKKLKSLSMQFVVALFFILIFFILKGLVLHSGMPIQILSLHDLEKGVVWLHFLMVIWGVAFALLFFKSHNYSLKAIGLRAMILIDFIILLVFTMAVFITDSADTSRILLFLLFMYVGFYIPYFISRKKNYYVLSALWILFFTLFLVENTAMLTKKKTESKYKVLAENIFINGNLENDKVTEILLDELYSQISNDSQLGKLVQNVDSIDRLSDYLSDNYLRGYWNKYNIQLAVVGQNSALYGQNKNLLANNGIPVGKTSFCALTSLRYDLSYMGDFLLITPKGEELTLFLTLTPRKNFKSYSFPKFLISAESDIQSRLKIAVARYHKGALVYSSENYKFPETSSFLPKRENLFYKFTTSQKTYYIYQPNKDNGVVITELNQYYFPNYFIYFAYILLFNLIIGFVFVWLVYRKRKTIAVFSRLSSKYQIAFVLLLLVSFVGIFYVSVRFITSKYKEQQIAEINKKKSYIQNALQEKYYWTEDISTVNAQGLNFDLQELSYIYQTDINVYDNFGRLVGSSQPLIYNKKLIGRQIAPEPFFGNNPTLNQEEYIGELRFLTGYTDLYNGDFLQIGYIAIPLYVSTEEIRSEIEEFLAVIVHIYLIIALLSVLLSFIIGKQLSAPLEMIESKLKKMRFGQKNEKIDYNENDEIGQLVKQYNKTIEKLEQSARLLAQTERESAWRTMARQIAHEINNPLTPMKLTIQQLQRTKNMNDERFDDYFAKSTVTLVEQIDNLSRIAGTFSNFARMPEARFERIDIATKLYSTMQLFSANNEDVIIRYTGLTENVFVLADPEQMLQVFNNLLKNAIQAIPTDRKGNILVSLNTENNQVLITIADNGSGIPTDMRNKVFMPNFTTKTTGMGLGLSITKNIVETAGGEISFTTNENSGSEFKIILKQEI